MPFERIGSWVQLNQSTSAVVIITTSATRLKKNTGIVYFVGKAARFTTSTIAIDKQVAVSKANELPVSITVVIVRTVKIVPWPRMLKAAQAKRFSSWLSA